MTGLIKYIFLGIMFFAPFTQFRLAGLKISEFLVLFIILNFGLRHKLKFYFSKCNEKFVILFILTIFISAVLSILDPINIFVKGIDKGPYYSFEYGWLFKIIRMYLVLCFAVILERQLIIKKTFFDVLCNYYIFINVLVDLYGIGNFFTTSSIAQLGQIRTDLFAAEPSEAGFINCFAIILALRNFISKRTKRNTATIGILIFGQLVIGSTTSIIAVIVSIFVTYVKYNKKNYGISRKMIIMCILSVGLCFSIFYWLANNTQILDKILNVQYDREGGSAIERITTIETCWEIFKVRPILGIGFGNFGWYVNHYVTSPLLLFTPGGAFQPNNTYMQILAELGVVGFGLYVWFIGQQFAKLNKILKYNSKNMLAYFCYALLSYLLIHGLTLPIIYSFQFWTLVAVIQSMSLIHQKNENTDYK